MIEREAETQAEGEAGSMQGAQRGTRTWDSRIMPWAEGSAKLLSHQAALIGQFYTLLSAYHRKCSHHLKSKQN